MANTIMHLTFDSSAGYLGAVDYLLEHIRHKEHDRNSNKYAFILVAASALESIINNAIIFWAHNYFEEKDYKRMASAFLSMSLRGKLDSYVHIVSDGQYTTNNESPIYRQLSELIKVRNEVAHAKDFYHKYELEMEEHGDGHLTFEIPGEFKKILEGSPLSIAYDQCLQYQVALHHLHDLVEQYNEPESFESSILCKKVTQQDAPGCAPKAARP